MVTLTDAEKAQLSETFQNGTYVEGFIILTDAEERIPQIGLPFLAFFGDWTAAPIFDSAIWTDEPTDGQNVLNNEAEWNVSILGYFNGYNYYNLGQNVFNRTDPEQMVFHPKMSPSPPTGFFRQVNDYILYQKRVSPGRGCRSERRQDR